MLLLDVSNSMENEMLNLAEATWAIRHAVDDLDGVCTVITWDHGPHRVIAKPGDHPDDRMFIPRNLGGTDPTTALADAYRLLANSGANNRLMVIMTDGEWAGVPGAAEKNIDAMRADGITTVLAHLGTYHAPKTAKIDAHHCEFAARIDTPQGLALLFRKVAAERISSHL